MLVIYLDKMVSAFREFCCSHQLEVRCSSPIFHAATMRFPDLVVTACMNEDTSDYLLTKDMSLVYHLVDFWGLTKQDFCMGSHSVSKGPAL